MSELWSFVKFHLNEANPRKDEQYLRRYIEFSEKIQTARQTHNWCLLCQYGFPILILLIRSVFFIYFAFNSDSPELQKIIYLDIFSLIDFEKLNSIINAFNVLLVYIYYIFYFSNKAEYYVESKRRLLSDDVDYFKRHWPFQYKNQQCASFVRRNTMRILYILQCFVTIAGGF